MTKRIVVAMSGGVDSSVAAALLKKEGHDVIGITMQIWPRAEKGDSCCSLSAVEDARRVANKLGIPYYVLDFQKIFKRNVIDYFISEYNLGRTPNPCVRCNQSIKFDALLKKSKDLGADYLATGHYARIEKKSGRYILKKGVDPKKDQSYFLYPLSQEALSRTIFPLGDMTKQEIRKLAKKFKLKVADKKESQEICFVDGDFGKLFSAKKGNIVDLDGKVLGKHKGYQLYTIGQRRGLGLSRKDPAYVAKIDPKTNTVAVGDRGDVYSDDLTAGELNWVSLSKLDASAKVTAKIRYNSPGAEAEIRPIAKGKVKVTFSKPQFAITPGQSVVFYDGDSVVGGGIIE
ncbi:MAG: tRNA 2-thiouridine(34) synthase MnmA [bacterium]